MRKTLYGLIAAAFSLTAAQGAFAADMPMKAAPVVAPVFTWTGFYAGLHGGAGWGTVESNIAIGGISLPLSSHDINGAVFGGQVGYNYQMGWAVLGVEATGSWSDIKGSAPCLVVITCTTKTDWMASVAGRFGGLVGNNTLVFVKGGAAWAHDKYDANVLGLVDVAASDTRFGWLIGLGGEYRFDPRWSGVIEYDYMDFGKDTVNFGAGGVTIPVSISHTNHLVKAGLNYKFY
jgi:outer membrane immunogenic protein